MLMTQGVIGIPSQLSGVIIVIRGVPLKRHRCPLVIPLQGKIDSSC